MLGPGLDNLCQFVQFCFGQLFSCQFLVILTQGLVSLSVRRFSTGYLTDTIQTTNEQDCPFNKFLVLMVDIMTSLQ